MSCTKRRNVVGIRGTVFYDVCQKLPILLPFFVIFVFREQDAVYLYLFPPFSLLSDLGGGGLMFWKKRKCLLLIKTIIMRNNKNTFSSAFPFLFLRSPGRRFPLGPLLSRPSRLSPRTPLPSFFPSFFDSSVAFFFSSFSAARSFAFSCSPSSSSLYLENRMPFIFISSLLLVFSATWEVAA